MTPEPTPRTVTREALRDALAATGYPSHLLMDTMHEADAIFAALPIEAEADAGAGLREALGLLRWAIGYIEYEYATPSLLHDKREGRNDQIMFERAVLAAAYESEP